MSSVVTAKPFSVLLKNENYLFLSNEAESKKVSKWHLINKIISLYKKMKLKYEMEEWLWKQGSEDVSLAEEWMHDFYKISQWN